MKTVLLDDSNRIVVKDVSLPKLGNKDILVEMKACGLCGTDIEKIRGEYVASNPVLGHEATGIVVDVGQDANEFKIGDRVFPHHHTACHNCHFCNKGNETMCDDYRNSNIDPGGFSEFFRVPEWNIQNGGVLEIPSEISFEEASFIEPIACCIRSQDRAGVSVGDSVLVIGAGPMGLIQLQLLKNLGTKAMISDINVKRLSISKSFGADHVYNINESNVFSKIKDDTDGLGVDVAIVATGSPKGIIQALKTVRKGGTICLFGVPIIGSILDYDFSDVFNSEISIISSYGATEIETKSALEMIKLHKIDSTSLITNRFKLDEFDEALKIANSDEVLKIVINP